jgi:serine O-acetyltransferase
MNENLKIWLVRSARPVVWPLRLGIRQAGVWSILEQDVAQWVKGITNSTLRSLPRSDQFVWLTLKHAEFRTLVLYRVRSLSLPTRIALRGIYRPLVTLDIECPDIGPGLFIQHGFATTITAARIGSNCWINQQVTIGFTSSGRPTIGDDVRIAAGAVVIGNITISDGATIGANATVVNDVAANDTVVAPKAVSIGNRGSRN